MKVKKPQTLHVSPLPRDPRDGSVKEGRLSLAIPAEGMTVVPGGKTPNRKWFAGAAGLVVVNGAAALGLDVGELVVDLAGSIGLDVSEAEAEAEIRSAIGALAGVYVWPEWLSLPQFVREAIAKITKPLRR